MKERNNTRKNTPVEDSKYGKFHKSPITSVPIPETFQNNIFSHTKSLICPEHTNSVCVYLLKCMAHDRATWPCHPSHSMPLALILPRGIDDTYLRRVRVCMYVFVCCVCVCFFVCLCVCVNLLNCT